MRWIMILVRTLTEAGRAVNVAERRVRDTSDPCLYICIDGASLSDVVEDGLLFLIQPGPVKRLGPISMQVGSFVRVGSVVC